MSSFALYIFTSIALIFVIEGLVYSLFPDAVRKMMAAAVMMEVEKLRLFGLVMAATGIILVWLLQTFANS